jgi:hypothetical protein
MRIGAHADAHLYQYLHAADDIPVQLRQSRHFIETEFEELEEDLTNLIPARAVASCRATIKDLKPVSIMK